MWKDIFLFACGAALTAAAVLYGNMSLFWVVVLWGGVVGMVISAVHGVASAYYRRATADTPPVILLGAADLLIIGLIATGVISWNAPAQAPPPPPPPPAAVAKPPAPQPPAPPKPKPPWVTDEEIEQQKKLGHTLLVYSPEELVAMAVAGRDLKIFEDKWIKIDYSVIGPPNSNTFEKKEYYVAEMGVNSGNTLSIGGVAAFFDPKKYGDRLLALRKGDHLKAICQFEGMQRSKPDTKGEHTDILLAYNCELL